MNLEQLQDRVGAGERFKYVFFWGHEPRHEGAIDAACLSQWYHAPFEVDGLRYPTAEHWMMAEKARLFADHDALKQILHAPHPGAAKELGRAVRGFDHDRWLEHRVRIVTEGNVHKFRRNPPLRDFLVGTNTRVLVEASPVDRIWGIGLGAMDAGADEPARWRGLNLLGFALMGVRGQLLKE